MAVDKAVKLQHQIRENAEELQDYLRDLANWEKEMKLTDEEIKTKGNIDTPALPPVRTCAVESKWKKSKDKKTKKMKQKSSKKMVEEECEKKRIAGYDYRAWDQFNVDEALKEIDENENKKASSEEKSEDSEDELFELEKKKQLALLEKDKGNEHFKKGKYDMAISCYTNGMLLDPCNPLLPGNRAMALLKKGQLAAAESDCNTCLKLDPSYIKAYHRRGTARLGLKKYNEARTDFIKVLQLDPGNAQAKFELENTAKALYDLKNKDSAVEAKIDINAQNSGNLIMQNENDSGIIKPIHKPPHLRSQKPMKKISIKNVTKISEVAEPISSRIQEVLDIPVHSDEKETDSFACGDSENICPTEATNQKPLFMDTSSSSLLEKVKPLPLPSLPTVPSTSYQFLTDWRKIRRHPDLQYKYLLQFPPERFPAVFKHSMETDLFTEILQILSTKFIESGDDVYPYLKYISMVGRFHILVMLLAEEEISALKVLFDYMRQTQKYVEEVSSLCNSYFL